MRIKFDENVSRRIVEAIRRLEDDTAVEITSVVEDYGQGSPDPEWMFRFAQEGGDAMISGDHNILQKPVNLVAYVESGLISVWPPSGWPNLKRFGQAAFVIRWWPVIKMKIGASGRGDRWRLPIQWTPDVEAMKPVKDPRVDRG